MSPTEKNEGAQGSGQRKVFVLLSWSDSVQQVVSTESTARQLGYKSHDDEGVTLGPSAGYFVECLVDEGWEDVQSPVAPQASTSGAQGDAAEILQGYASLPDEELIARLTRSGPEAFARFEETWAKLKQACGVEPVAPPPDPAEVTRLLELYLALNDVFGFGESKHGQGFRMAVVTLLDEFSNSPQQKVVIKGLKNAVFNTKG